MERIPNNLSGIYFRYLNKDTRKWENWCFEDLPVEEQEKYINDRSIEWLKNMTLMLAKTLKDVGDEFGIKSVSSPIDEDF